MWPDDAKTCWEDTSAGLYTFRCLCQPCYHIQNPGPAINHVMVLPHEPAICTHVKVAGQSYGQIAGWGSLTAFYLAEVLQPGVQCFCYFLLRHSSSLTDSA